MQEKNKQVFSLDKRSLFAGFFGNILEWYDFTVYGFFAVIIGNLFFPSSDSTVSLIAAFAVFAVGYLMRPFGGIIFGHIGDRYGRKKALFLSILMMAIPTSLIGLLPTHQQVGWYAALMLMALRLLQGLSVGGEFTGSISFLVEKAPEGKRGYYGSWTTFGVMGGMLLGSAIATVLANLLTPAQLYNFGWRIPFLLGSLIGVMGLYLRKDMTEGEQFERVRTEGISRSPLKEFWKEHKIPAIKLIMISWGFAVSVYLVLIFLPTYMHKFHGVSLDRAFSTHTIAMIVMMLLIPSMGKLSDKIGRKPVMMLGMAGFVFLTFPLFALLFETTFLAILAAMLVFVVMEGMLQAALPALMSEMFPTRIRYTGLSVSYNISLALFGGTAPLIATWLIKISDNVWAPAFYLVSATLVSLITLVFVRETAKKPLK